MKSSEVIKQLEKLIKEQEDLEVKTVTEDKKLQNNWTIKQLKNKIIIFSEYDNL